MQNEIPVSTLSISSKYHSEKTKLINLIHDLRKLGFHDVETLFKLLSIGVKGQQDDSLYTTENLIQILAKWGKDSEPGEKLTNLFINQLWNSLPHPTLTSLGEKYKYRSADGGMNNIRLPDLGRAGSPYARTVKPERLQSIALPDPGRVFDCVMARDSFEPHPNKISSMLFYLASIIIHDIFLTDHNDFNTSLASSYLDLAPLYGNNESEQREIRTLSDGKLKPDCFSEKRILGFPPGVGVFLIMFNRFHNSVVTQLALINENNRFKKPVDPNDKDAWAKYDNDLFQTGRLITCGLYINIVLKDYVRTILNLNRTDSKWNLDPRAEETKSLFKTPTAEAVGNQVSVEFNAIYRWHSAISERDEKWTIEKYDELFPNQDHESVSVRELIQTLEKFNKNIPNDPVERSFANLTRKSDGTFHDDDLVKILKESILDVAGSFGANRVPKILRSVEILGIVQSRVWNMASLNEFREAFGLVKHERFEDINPDPNVCESLRNLYDHPDNVELYPGVVVEKAKKPVSPGSGLCVNFTTSYAILSDAVGLVRGDRFYTIDYTAKNLTNWGYKEVESDTSINEGCVIHKLILRAFPNHFKDNSIYAHFPFVIPQENLLIQTSLKREEKYSWDKPYQKNPAVVIRSQTTAKKILRDPENWKPIGGHNVLLPINILGTESYLSGDALTDDSSATFFKRKIYLKEIENDVKTFFQETTTKLLKESSFKTPGEDGYQVDIVRDISNLVNARYAALIFNLPIKTEDSPHGKYSDKELYQTLALLHYSIVYNYVTAKGFEIREAAREATKHLGDLVLTHTKSIASPGLFAEIISKIFEGPPLPSFGTALVKEILDSRVPVDEVVWNYILPTAASMTAGVSLVFSQVVDYYLGEGSKYLPDLFECSRANTKKADEKLEKYLLEGARLSATNGFYRDYCPASGNNETVVIADDASTYSISTGGRVLIDLPGASRDAAVFPKPNEVNLKRPLESYILFGFGPSDRSGKDLSIVAMTAMLKVIFGLKGLRRVDGSGPGGKWIWGESQGEMKKIQLSPINSFYMTPDQANFFPFPTTMKIQWDSE